MPWEVNGNGNGNSNQRGALTLACMGETTEVDLEGAELVAKIERIAKKHGIKKFDVLDSTAKILLPDAVKRGKFTGTLLTISKYNQAA
jgi:hypothetical protein